MLPRLAFVLSVLALLLLAGAANAQRVLLVEPPRTDVILSEAFNRLRAELLLQEFEVTVLSARASGISRETLEVETQAQQAFAGILLERSPNGATAEICIADRVTGKTSQRRLAIGDVREAPRVLAVRAVDLLRSSLRELPAGERPPPDVIGVQNEPVAPEVRSWSEEPSRFQLRAAGSMLGGLSELGSAFGGSVGLFYLPLDWLRVGVVATGPLMGARYTTDSGSATVRQELGLAQCFANLLPAGRFRLGPALGAGAYHLQAHGEVGGPLRSRSDGVWSFAGSAGVDAELHLSRALALTGSLGALLLTPRPVVAVDTEEEAVAAPVLLASLGMGVAFLKRLGGSRHMLGALLVSSLGCGRDVAQTAERPPPEGDAFECETAPAPALLPSAGPFGDGQEPRSALAGNGYGAGEGPGVYVVARDRFRVYLNGELVHEGASSRVAEFVPLTVLPGDNVLAVVVVAALGTPAALVQLDELEQSHPSDASWHVSTSPTGDFHDPLYDDSTWPVAVDLGALGTRPGCDPAGVFPTPSTARWIGPAPRSGSIAVFRKLVRVAATGYGAGTSGGLNATPVLVATFDELALAVEHPDTPAIVLLAEGVHDFRQTGADVREQLACPLPCENDPTKIAYTLLTGSETCPVELVPRTRDERRLDLGSNKTIVGLGRGAALRGVSINVGTARNVIVRNIALHDVNPALIEAGDAFSLGGASQIWLDHCTTKWISDGFTDVGTGSQNVTISWMHYDGASPEACTGQHPRTSQITDSSVTFQHSYFDHVESHSPLADHPNARVHVLNNFLSDNPDSAVGAACGARILMEGNVFEAVDAPTLRTSCPDNSSLGLIRAPAGSNLYRDDVGAHRGGDGMEPNDAVEVPPYAYTVEPAQDAWLRVLSRAGAGGPWALPLVRD